MHIFSIITIFSLATLLGVEFSVSAFINPTVWLQPAEVQLKMLSRFAVVLGRVMPAWYPSCAVLLGFETWLRWQTSGRSLLLIADAIWVLTSLASVLFLVPLNTRVAEESSDWQPLHRTWDKRHRFRIAALAIAFLLVLDALVS